MLRRRVAKKQRVNQKIRQEVDTFVNRLWTGIEVLSRGLGSRSLMVELDLYTRHLKPAVVEITWISQGRCGGEEGPIIVRPQLSFWGQFDASPPGKQYPPILYKILWRTSTAITPLLLVASETSVGSLASITTSKGRKAMGCSSSKVSPPTPKDPPPEDAKPALADAPDTPGARGEHESTLLTPLDSLPEEEVVEDIEEGPKSPEFGVIDFTAFTSPLPLYDDGLITHGDILSAILPTVMKPKEAPKEEGEEEVARLEDERMEEDTTTSHGPRVYTTPFLPTALLTSVPYGQCLALNSAPEGEDLPGGEGAINAFDPATVYVGKLRLGTALARRVPFLTPMVSQVTKVHHINHDFGGGMATSLSLFPSSSSSAMASAVATMEPRSVHHEAHVPLSLEAMQALRPVPPPPALALLLASHPGSTVLSSHPAGHPQWVMIRADRGPMEHAQAQVAMDKALEAGLGGGDVPSTSTTNHLLPISSSSANSASLPSSLPSLLEVGRKELSSAVRRYCTMGLPPPLVNVGYYECDVFVATPGEAEVDLDGRGGPYVEIPRLPFALVKLPHLPSGGRDEGVSVTSYGGLKMSLDLIYSLRVAPTVIKNRGLDLYEGLSQFAGQDYI